jgi:hypothetical protein
VAKVLDCWPNKCEVLSSSSSAAKIEKKSLDLYVFKRCPPYICMGRSICSIVTVFDAMNMCTYNQFYVIH